ncbi:MAG: glycosyltransferase family A protein, partial [Pseudomonadota bacterium]
MPVFEQEDYVAAAISSVLGQTHRELELIIVDDGSGDETADIVSAFRDSRIRYVRRDRRLGLAARRNEAIEMAAGEYVAQMDADAVCAPDRLAVQLLSLRAGYDICGSWATRGAHPLRPDGTVSFPVGSKAL